MLGKQRVRKALAVAGSAAVLVGLATFGPSPVDAEVVTVEGEAFGIDGLVTIPAGQDPEVDPEETIEIEPTPAVVLPSTGSDDIIEESVLGFVEPGVIDIDIMYVSTQGSLSTANVNGGVFSETLLDNVELLSGLIVAEELESECLHREDVQATAVNFNELVIDGTPIEQSPEPNTVVSIPDVGEARLNVVEEVAGRIQVIAMELVFDIEGEVAGSLRLGLAECGTEVLDVVDDQPVVPESQLADAFEGDPEFTG
ncbi:hypothetical protein B7486_55895 [cyanobacterium TDX16]|nr:hypothetical protein B7486_55895 [cyanobacterium TDX16]